MESNETETTQQPTAAEGGEQTTQATEATSGEETKPKDGQAAAAAAKTPEPAKKPEADLLEERETALRVQMRQRERQIEERESKAKLSEADHAELSDFRQRKKNAKADPLGAMEWLELTPEEVFKAAKEGRTPLDPAVRKALAEVDAIKKRDAEREENDKKAKQAAAEAERDTKVKEGLTAFIKTNEAKYEFTAARGAKGVQTMIETAVAYHAKHGRMPDLDKLAGHVEKAYEAEYDAAHKTKKAQAKSKPAKAADGEGERKSVTNDMDSTPSTPPKPTGGAKTRSQSLSEEISGTWQEILRERQQREAEGNA